MTTSDTQIQTLDLDLGHHRYSIHIGPDALTRAPLRSMVASDQVCIVTNETIAPLYLEAVKRALGDINPLVVSLPDGERYKNLESAERVWSALLEAGFRRNATLIALGGGVVGDLTGFVAASYQRGVPFIQIPTTLLSQVDSSVGGKTAVNHPLGKNMIGAFHQPEVVISDLSTFATLPEAEFWAGMAEVVKYGLIEDADFFRWIQANVEVLKEEFFSLRKGHLETPNLSHMIRRCCEIKALVVQDDEREQGKRAILNLGHTFGHAIEAHVAYQGWRHGEAVAVGMRMALDLSWRLGWVKAAVVSDTHALLDCLNLPVRPPSDMTPEHFIQHMGRDKKLQNANIRLVLLKSLGEACITDEVPESKLHECLSHFCTAGH